MENVSSDEKRDSVRAALRAEVQFTVMDGHEYEAARDVEDARPHRFISQPMKLEVSGEEESYPVGRAVDPNLIEFLVHLEDKLDRVLKLLSKDEKCDQDLFIGKGVDIGAIGMRILCDKAVKPGQVLKIGLRIFRYPVISLEVFGEVLRVTPVEENRGQRYEVAVKFLDLDEEYREWIIAYVFQMQRETIRNSKKR